MFVTRFAPSPTGYLHFGHAFAAMTAHDAAQGGRFLLRIEDLDLSRCREVFVEGIFDDLRWLDLGWEEPVLRQSARAGVYRSALDELDRSGLIYPCFCTRAEVAAEIARCEKSGAPFALRLDSAKAAERVGELSFHEARGYPYTAYDRVSVNPVRFGDIVLARKDTPASYHLAVVIDDAEQGVTLVTRGRDLLSSTHVHRVLQSLLGLPAPKYAHHRLILDSDGRKMSKRDGAQSLRALRTAGAKPADVAAMLHRA